VLSQTRTGKGNALACGFAAATGDIIVMIDADGSTDPAEIPRFVEALTAGADFAKGSRFAPGAGSTDITPLRKLGNKLLGRDHGGGERGQHPAPDGAHRGLEQDRQMR
jgi:glycosyltransferase involved in cell wall biosynthesis